MGPDDLIQVVFGAEVEPFGLIHRSLELAVR